MVSRQTVARTIRLDPAIDRILKQEAEQLGLTHTAVTTMALRKYTNFDRFADKIGSLTVSKETLSRLLQLVSHDDAEIVGEASNFAGKNSKQYMNLLFGHSRLEDFFEMLKVLQVYAHLFEFEHQTDGTRHHLIFAHNMGSKWSAFLQGAIQATLKEEYGLRAKFERTESFLSCTFEERS